MNSAALIEHAQLWRALLSNPLACPSPERPWKLNVMWNNGDEMVLHFATEGGAERALTVLVEYFHDQIDLECSGPELLRWAAEAAAD